MAQLPEVFSRKDSEPMDAANKPVPEGWYTAQIVKSEIKDTSTGTGKRLNLSFKIMEGEYANKMVFEGLNIVNPNPQAVEISKRMLRSICDALDIEELGDTNELHGQPMKVKVGIKPANANWPESNKINNVKSVNDDEGEGDNPFA